MDELDEVHKTISKLKEILADESIQFDIIKTELLAIKENTAMIEKQALSTPLTTLKLKTL